MVTPEQVREVKSKKVNSDVEQIVDTLLLERANKRQIIIYQDEIVKALKSLKKYSRKDIFENGLLDFEDAYGAQGWKVTYDKPAYNEDYRAYFLFEFE